MCHAELREKRDELLSTLRALAGMSYSREGEYHCLLGVASPDGEHDSSVGEDLAAVANILASIDEAVPDVSQHRRLLSEVRRLRHSLSSAKVLSLPHRHPHGNPVVQPETTRQLIDLMPAVEAYAIAVSMRIPTPSGGPRKG